jgi:tetratricopeptide (TPR) repeat protein
MKTKIDMQLKDYLVIVACFIAVGILVFCYTRALLSLRILIMLLALGPLVLVNYFMIKSKNRPPKFKKSLAVFSAVFAAFFCALYLWLVPLPANNKIGAHEFGVLFVEFGHWDKRHINSYHELAQRLGHVKATDAPAYGAVHFLIVPLDTTDFPGVKRATLAAAKMEESNARLACFCVSDDNDSLSADIFVDQAIIAQGFHRENFKLKSPREQFVQTMAEHITALWEFANGKAYTAIDKISNAPQAIRMLQSAEQFKQGTRLIEQLRSLESKDPERDRIVNEAEETLLNSVQHDSLNDKAYNILAHINRYYRNNDSEANAFYKKAQSLQPDNYEYTWNLAQHYHQLGQDQEAIKVLRDYLAAYGKELEPSKRVAMELLPSSYQQK